MSDLKDRLRRLDRNRLDADWHSLETDPALNPRDRMEKLVHLHLAREKTEKNEQPDRAAVEPEAPFICREYHYSERAFFGPVQLGQWRELAPESLAVVSGDPSCSRLPLEKIAFFDTETTGLAGGTGTIPFVLGIGFFEPGEFRVKAFVLHDPAAEGEMLAAFDLFLAEKKFSAVASYNGRSFDFPLMETRYIMQRRRFPWSSARHIDFLHPARKIWKNSQESCKLSHLGEMLLGLSREDDLPGAEIPALYNSFLRRRDPSMLEAVVDHNALDLVGLAGLMLLACRYVENPDQAKSEGEILGIAVLLEKAELFQRALSAYEKLSTASLNSETRLLAARSHSRLLKKMRFYDEACAIWKELEAGADPLGCRELALHLEHRRRDLNSAMQVVRRALEVSRLNDRQRDEMEKRLARLAAKIERLEKSAPAEEQS